MEKDSSLDRITLALSKLKSELVSYEENKILYHFFLLKKSLNWNFAWLITHFFKLIFINSNRFGLEKQSFYETGLSFQMDMRSQDVKLMKQLISINITIGSMTKSGHRNPVLRSASVCSLKPRSMERIANRRSAEVTTCLRNPLVRHRSAPVMVQGDERDDSNSGTQIFHASIRPFTFLLLYICSSTSFVYN